MFSAFLFSQKKKKYFQLHDSFAPMLENAIKTKNHFMIYMIYKDYFLEVNLLLIDSKDKIYKRRSVLQPERKGYC